LPGFTRIPLENSDQTEDIEKITKEMSKGYIIDDRTIILCVLPANSDLATSDSLKLAREIDKEGKRTLGVLTKIDIMDKGTSARKILKNELIRLRHGYIAVKNRSQADIQAKVQVKEALQAEDEYFKRNEDLKGLGDLLGTKVLSKKLCDLLHCHILACLPQIETEIFDNIKEKENSLRVLGNPFPKENSQKLCYLLFKSKEIAQQIKSIMENGDTMDSDDIDSEFKGFACFNLFISKFNKEKNDIFTNTLKGVCFTQVMDIIKKKGLALPGFLPKETIENKVRQGLESLKAPINKFIENVNEHIKSILKQIFENMESVSGGARRYLHRLGLDFLEEQTKDTIDYLDKLIEFEKLTTWTFDQKYFLENQGSEDFNISSKDYF